MKKHTHGLAALFVAFSIILGTTSSAFAAETSPASKKDLLHNSSLFEQILISEETVVENGVVIGTISRYKYIPMAQSLGITNTCVLEAVFKTRNNAYARLTGYFMFDGKSASCFDSSVETDLTNYNEKSRTVTGNGTAKATLKLKFTFTSMMGESQLNTLTLWCDKDGHTS